MKFLVAAENGKISHIQAAKVCNALDKNTPLPAISTIHRTSEDAKVQCMALLNFPSHTRGDVEAAAVACSDGSVLILDCENGELLAKIDGTSNNVAREDALIVSIEIRHGYIATCTLSGEARFTKVSSLWGDEQLTHQTQLPGPVSVMRMHPEVAGIIAFGGEENDLQLWSTMSGDESFKDLQVKWTARNVKNDKLDLRVPIWITDLQFLPNDSETDYKIVTSTHYKQMRLYETKTARRPVASVKLSEHAITHLITHCSSEKESLSSVVFTDSAGHVLHASLKEKTIIGSYKGFSGAVTALCLSYDGTAVAAGGMDSYLRVFSTAGHQELLSVYLGARINHILVLADEVEIKSEEPGNDEDEDVWDNLEEVDERQIKRARQA